MKKLALLILTLISLTSCGYSLGGTRCVHGTLYWMSEQGVATLVIDTDNKPVHCGE